MADRKKELAKVVSQEMLGGRDLQYVARHRCCKDCQTGTVYFNVYKERRKASYRVQSVSVRLTEKAESFGWYTV